MKRILAVCLLTGFYFVVQTWFTQTTSNAPTVAAECGTITGNTTWTVISSPYEVCFGGVTIGPTATLTIQPGVTVQFQPSVNAKLYIQGALSAIGTLTQPITFTGVVATPGSWGGLSADYSVITPALVSLKYVTLEDVGGGSAVGQIYVDRAMLTMTHSLVRNGSSNGLHFTAQAIGFNVQTTSFVSNTLSAIQIDYPTTDLDLNDLSATGNGTNGVHISNVSTYMRGQRRWTNPGIPYVIDDHLINEPGDALTIDPGSDLQFVSNSELTIGGQLTAVGSAYEPITLTAQNQTPGGWRGLVIAGTSTQNAVAQLGYATLEYGGGDIGGANIIVGNGQLIARHTVVRYSAKGGILFNIGGGGSILNSQIVSNSQIVTSTYGVYNSVPVHPVLATNDWWGDPNGPQSDVVACSTGHGDKVSTGVLFRPVLTDTHLSAEFPLSDAPQMTLTPRRWFAPADGLIRVYFDITLRDGNGTPMVGRVTRLHTTLGTVTDGCVTDVNGHTLGYLTSPAPGDADVYLTLDTLSACEGATSPSAKITFTPPFTGTDLFPDSPAPYVSAALKVAPLPVVRGVTTTVTARLTNPLTVPITVDIDLEYAQSGVGLVFGPLAQLNDQVIPASGTITLTQPWIPPISGHYCFQLAYAITAIGAQRINRRGLNNFDNKTNLNNDSLFAGLKSDDQRGILQKTTDALNIAGEFIDKAYDTDPFAIPLFLSSELIAMDLSYAQSIGNALAGDPPVQDYQQIALPQRLPIPLVQPNSAEHISQARADAMNAFADALTSMTAYGRAAAIANDRNAGAAQAKDLQWESLQTSALLDYRTSYAEWAITTSLKLNDLITQAASEGDTSVIITPDQVRAFQQKLATTGFTAQQIADAHSVGMTDDYISYTLHSLIAADPNVVAGDYIVYMQSVANDLAHMGNAFLHPEVFAPLFSVGGSAGLRASQAITPGNTMAQAFDNSTTVLLSNPLTQTAVIDVRARRIDLPADWGVTVSPAQVTLAPGEVTTVTVNLLPGSSAPQGNVPQIAIEGYAGNQLLGGVAVQMGVPDYVPGFLRTFMPLIRK